MVRFARSTVWLTILSTLANVLPVSRAKPITRFFTFLATFFWRLPARLTAFFTFRPIREALFFARLAARFAFLPLARAARAARDLTALLFFRTVRFTFAAARPAFLEDLAFFLDFLMDSSFHPR